jgi:hypothetical protein
MKMKKLVCFAFATALLSACSNSGNKTTPAGEAQNTKTEITNDMESASSIIPSWQNEKTVISVKEPAAHSGEFVCITNDTAEFGYTYAELVKNISSVIPKKVSVSGWVFTTISNPKFSIILDVSENGKLYDWKAFPLDSINETGKWIEFNASFYFDKPLNQEQTIKLYPWNQSKKPVYIDDLKITFE